MNPSKEQIVREAQEEFVEAGAALEHERWSGWQKHLHSRLDKNKAITPLDFDRWERQIATPYSELSEQEKESDRREVRTYLPLLASLVEKAYTAGEEGGRREPHETVEGYCCACGYDIAVMEEELAAKFSPKEEGNV